MAQNYQFYDSKCLVGKLTVCLVHSTTEESSRDIIPAKKKIERDRQCNFISCDFPSDGYGVIVPFTPQNSF
jgi:hypothetical protein